MAEVAYSRHHARYSEDLESLEANPALLRSAPRIEMMVNHDFVFPRTMPTAPSESSSTVQSRRPQSFSANHHAFRPPTLEHRRVKSSMPLPSFSFNAANTSGLQEETTPMDLDDEPIAPLTPSKGHKRTTSEFVGGDSRLLATTAKAAPAPSLASQPIPITNNRPNHRHRRSAAISSHDLAAVMRAPEPAPRLSTSAPNSPIECLPQMEARSEDPFGPTSEASVERPPSRRQVEFSDKVEFIPRPLSTISSGTEGSISTRHGHAINDSISSMLSLGTPSPPSMRIPVSTLATTVEAEADAKVESSKLPMKRVEREGQWLRTGSLRSGAPRPISAPLSSTVHFPLQDSPVKARESRRVKDAQTRAMDLERRQSEPLLQPVETHLAPTQSLEPVRDIAQDARGAERRSSSRKLKQWAMSKMSRTTAKKHARGQSEFLAPAEPVADTLRGALPALTIPTPIAETNLDAVFGGPASPRERRAPLSGMSSRMEEITPATSQTSLGKSNVADDELFMLDLDSALGPLQAPASGAAKQRRGMHSGRLNRDFLAPGIYLPANPNHRRTESAPMLTPFDSGRLSTPALAAMADVFEEDEEEADSNKPERRGSTESDEAGTGIQIVDSDPSSTTDSLVSLDALRNQEAHWGSPRPSTGYSRPPIDMTASLPEHQPSSIVQETIVEESTPSGSRHSMHPLDNAFGRGAARASSLTKSSDSSETPTILPNASDCDAFDTSRPQTSSDTCNSPSAYSTPDLGRGQTSFDTSRLGTSASSATDNRTISSYATTHDLSGGLGCDPRQSVDDVPSLTSSRSTMMSTLHNVLRPSSMHRDFSADDLRPRLSCTAPTSSEVHEPSPHSRIAIIDYSPTIDAPPRRKRQSIQSLSQLVSGPFVSSRNSATLSSASASPVDSPMRPQTASNILGNPYTPFHSIRSSVSKDSLNSTDGSQRPVEHLRLKKLMFWKTKGRQSSLPASVTPRPRC
jgi:hypothetical protein